MQSRVRTTEPDRQYHFLMRYRLYNGISIYSGKTVNGKEYIGIRVDENINNYEIKKVEVIKSGIKYYLEGQTKKILIEYRNIDGFTYPKKFVIKKWEGD